MAAAALVTLAASAAGKHGAQTAAAAAPVVALDSTYRVTSVWGYTIALNRYVLRRPPQPQGDDARRQNTSVTSKTTSPNSTGRVVLVLGHANGFCKEMWEPVLAELQPLLQSSGSVVDTADDAEHGLVCYAWDLHCHGASDVIPPPTGAGVGSYRWRAHGQDLANALDFAIGLEQKRQSQSRTAAARTRALRLVGVGHSMGGSNLIALQLYRPGVFHTLMCIEPVLPPLKHTRAQSDAAPNHLRDGAKHRRSVFPDDRAFVSQYFGEPKRFGAWDVRALDAYARGAFRRVPAQSKPTKAAGAAVTVDSTDAKAPPKPQFELVLACPPAAESEFYAAHTMHGMYFELDKLVCDGLFALVTAADSDMYVDAWHRALCASLTNNGVQAATHDHYAAAKGLLHRRWAFREPAGGHLIVHTKPARTAQLIAHALYAWNGPATALNDACAADLYPPPSDKAAEQAKACVDALMERLRKQSVPTVGMPIAQTALAAARSSAPETDRVVVSPARSHAVQLRAKL